MKALLLTPTYFPLLTGNAVTVDRIGRHLTQSGIASTILNLSELRRKHVIRTAELYQPDIVHAFHAYKSGRIGRLAKDRTGAYLITTMTGTDLNVDLKSRRKKKAIIDVLDHSDAITVFNEAAREILLQADVPREKLTVIHQSVSFPETPFIDFREHWKIRRDAVVFLAVGAIRKIKNIGLAFRVLQDLKCCFPQIHLIIAGPVIEDDAFQELLSDTAGKDWVTYAGVVARENIRSLFLCADIFLNTSFSESESNAMLEAISCGMIVIGRDIPGNSSLLTEETGLLFANKKDLTRKIIYAVENIDGMRSMREKAAALAFREFNQTRERNGYIDLYKLIAKKA
jgi:L-malate glycosyltransferase